MNFSALPRIHLPEAYVYRFTRPEFSGPTAAVSGEGGMKAPGRYSRPGIARVLYASFDERTAFEESLRLAQFLNIPIHRMPPLVWLSLKVARLDVIDLTDPEVSEALGVSPGELISDWRNTDPSSTQEIGVSASQSGVMALITPSAAAPARRNLVIFPENLQHPDQVECVTPVSWT